MEVNIEKMKVLKFSGNDHKCKTNFYYREKMIENVINYKYLGFNAYGPSQMLWKIYLLEV